MIFTSPCAHAPLMPISIQHKGEGVPMAQGRTGHRALKLHENKKQPALIYCIQMGLTMNFN